MKNRFLANWLVGGRRFTLLLVITVAVAFLLSGTGLVSATASLNWQYQTIPDTALSYIIYGDNQLVAGSDELLLLSEDGQSWQPYLQNMNANAIAFGNGYYVAVGNQGRAWSSPDGIVWTARETGASYEYLDVIFDGTRFVAVGRNQGRMVSNDGLSWEIRETGTDLMTLTAVAFHNPQYVAVGVAGRVMIYTDPLTDGNDYSISGAGNFSAIVTGPETIEGKVLLAVGAGGQIYRSSDGGQNWSEVSSGTTADLFDLCWSDDLSLFVAVGANGVILTSEHGQDWTDRSLASLSTSVIKSVTWDGSQYVAVSGNSTIIRSTDGITWTTEQLALTSMTNDSFEGFAWNGDNSLCVAILKSGYLATSTDGRDWTLRTDMIADQLHDITWGDGRFVAVGYKAIRISTDGQNWTSIATEPLADSLDLSAVTWGNGLYTAVSEWPARVYTSPDGQIWTQRYEAEMAGLYDVIWTGSQFVAVGYFDLILTSADGINWEEISPPTPPETSHVYTHMAVAWGNGIYVTASLARDGTACMLSSTDLLTWQRFDPDLANTPYLRDVAFGGGLFVAVGDRGACLSSEDGQNWAVLDPVTAFSLYSVHWGADQFISGGLSAILLAADAPARQPPENNVTPPPDNGTTQPSGSNGSAIPTGSEGEGEGFVETGEAAGTIPWLVLALLAVLLICRVSLRRERRQTDF